MLRNRRYNDARSANDLISTWSTSPRSSTNKERNAKPFNKTRSKPRTVVGILVMFALGKFTTRDKFSRDNLLKDKPPTFSNATFFESRGDNLRFQCKQRQSNKAAAPGVNVKLALAKFIVFQSNTGHQLQNFMAYYSQVIPLQDIVIIDHQTDVLNADEYTNSLLHRFNDLGAHVWHCEGSFAHKAEMWSWVTNRYTHSAEWVFPLDIDEYIAIAVNTPMKNKGSQDIGNEVISWNKADFKNALLKLEDTGKPFKMEKGDVYPVDCKFDQDVQMVQNANVPSISKGATHVIYDGSPMQKIKYVGRRKEQRIRCMDKVFFRGKDFNFTDTGNHFGQTHTISGKEIRKRCPRNSMSNSTNPDPSLRSELFMIHVQFTNFEEWLMHALRGAAARGFNRFSFLRKCRIGMVSREYCLNWRSVLETNFDPRAMKRMYQGAVCGQFRDGATFPLSISQVIHSSED